jgi:hypothetical protein
MEKKLFKTKQRPSSAHRLTPIHSFPHFFPYHLPMGLHINDSVFLGCEQVETLIFMHKLKKKAFSYLPKNVKGEPSASP